MKKRRIFSRMLVLVEQVLGENILRANPANVRNALQFGIAERPKAHPIILCFILSWVMWK